MKKQKNLKALVLSLVMAVGMLLPMTTNAQNTDGFFRSGNNENYNNRGDVTIEGGGPNGFLTQDLDEVPMGCGLIILTVAGAGYALTKRRKENK